VVQKPDAFGPGPLEEDCKKQGGNVGGFGGVGKLKDAARSLLIGG